MRLGDWADDAACWGMDPEAFVPAGTYSGPSTRRILRVCDGCPVREPCRDHMLDTMYGPRSIIAGGWVWNARGVPRPHPADFRVWRELVAAAVARRNLPARPPP